MSKANVYCQNVFDGTHESPKPSKGNHKLITSKNIMNGYIDSTDAYYISDEDYKKIQIRSAVKQWDVLISMIGTVGNVCIVQDKDIDYAIKNMGVFSCGDEYKAKWLYYYLQSPYLKKLNSNYLNGAIQKFLPLGYLRNLDIPDFVQNKIGIVDLLWNLDSKISLNNKIISELESMAKTIYDYWFLQFEFPNEEGKPYKSSGGKMVWNEELKREIPEGWKVKELSQYIDVVRGVSYSKEEISGTKRKGYIPLLKSNNLQDGRINLTDLIFVKKHHVSKEQFLDKNSVFITMSSGSTEHVGKTALMLYDANFTYGAFCSKISIKPKCKCFIGLFFISDYFKNKIRKIVVGTNIKNISISHLINNFIPFPDDLVLKNFEQLVNPILNTQGELIRENQELTSFRDFLLPLLMNGQVGFKDESK